MSLLKFWPKVHSPKEVSLFVNSLLLIIGTLLIRGCVVSVLFSGNVSQ